MKILILLSLVFFNHPSAFATSQSPLAYCTGPDTSVAVIVDSADGSRQQLVYQVSEEGRVIVDTAFNIESVSRNANEVTYATPYMDLSISSVRTAGSYAGTMTIKAYETEIKTALTCTYRDSQN
ncbi:MAG: hypothetical protein H7333_10810 [Bdellovibrionales bacterium]|nr:hypothetical protein [Oligoflexia bacterium]